MTLHQGRCPLAFWRGLAIALAIEIVVLLWVVTVWR
jgi:hypothetical protein